MFLGKISVEEKWSRLMVLKKLAYRSQFLNQQAITDGYAGFLRKIEIGKFKWGSEEAFRELDESLHFKMFTSLKRPWDRVGDRGTKKGGADNNRTGRKFYCLDFNRGSCQFSDSHEGRFNRANVWKIHMCRKCWEKDGKECKHPEGHVDCPHTAN